MCHHYEFVDAAELREATQEADDEESLDEPTPERQSVAPADDD